MFSCGYFNDRIGMLCNHKYTSPFKTERNKQSLMKIEWRRKMMAKRALWILPFHPLAEDPTIWLELIWKFNKNDFLSRQTKCMRSLSRFKLPFRIQFGMHLNCDMFEIAHLIWL